MESDGLRTKRLKTAPKPKHVELEDLVERKCRCGLASCYTQFRSRVHQIRRVRDSFNDLEPSAKNSFIRNALNLSDNSAELLINGNSDEVLVTSESEADNGLLLASDSDAELLLVSDDEFLNDEADKKLPASDNDAELLLASDIEADSDLLIASDTETAPNCKDRRQYAPNRRKCNSMSFLGENVCRRAYERLLGVGGSTIRRIKAGEDAYTNKSRSFRALTRRA